MVHRGRLGEDLPSAGGAPNAGGVGRGPPYGRDATSGRIPILWTKTAAEEGIDDEEYNKFLRWYGERLRNDLWRPMWVVRSREMASMEENDDAS